MITPKSFMIRFCSFCFTTSYYTSFFFVIILSIINVCPINVIFMVLCIINSMIHLMLKDCCRRLFASFSCYTTLSGFPINSWLSISSSIV